MHLKQDLTYYIINQSMNKDTKAIHTPFRLADAYGAIAMPVYHTAAYEFEDALSMIESFSGRSGMPDYSRVTNPTVYHFEDQIKALTGAESVFALNSGMAAIANTLMAVAATGKNIVTSRHVFGNTFALINSTLARFGVESRLVDLTDLEEVEAAVDAQTCCIYLEIVTNPQLEVADLRELARIAHSADIPLIADTTAIPFTEFSAKASGVDIEVVSTTKYLGAGAGVGGAIIDYGTCPGFGERIRTELMFNLGAYMTPHVAYMQSLGLETLGVRYQRQASSALTVAKALRELPQVKSVNYTGLEDNPYHDLAESQFGPTAGAMLTIDLKDKDACFRFLDNLKVFKRATNLFDNKSLAIHPASTIFVNFTDEQRAEMDLYDTTIRLSIGLEDPEDLISDIKQALNA